MSYDQLYAIAAQGMSLEKLRVDIVANNIANQHSINMPGHQGFEAQTVMAQAQPFEAFLEHSEGGGIAAVEVLSQHLPADKVYQPGHPAADEQGYISYPGISMVDEMTTMVRASRAYEANLKMMNAAHGLYLQALHIGEDR